MESDYQYCHINPQKLQYSNLTDNTDSQHVKLNSLFTMDAKIFDFVEWNRLVLRWTFIRRFVTLTYNVHHKFSI